jgi:hypothetical protein
LCVLRHACRTSAGRRFLPPRRVPPQPPTPPSPPRPIAAHAFLPTGRQLPPHLASPFPLTFCILLCITGSKQRRPRLPRPRLHIRLPPPPIAFGRQAYHCPIPQLLSFFATSLFPLSHKVGRARLAARTCHRPLLHPPPTRVPCGRPPAPLMQGFSDVWVLCRVEPAKHAAVGRPGDASRIAYGPRMLHVTSVRRLPCRCRCVLLHPSPSFRRSSLSLSPLPSLTFRYALLHPLIRSFPLSHFPFAFH